MAQNVVSLGDCNSFFLSKNKCGSLSIFYMLEVKLIYHYYFCYYEYSSSYNKVDILV